MRTALVLVVALVVLSPLRAVAHDIERAEALLLDVAAHRRAAAEAPVESERAEAVFRLGETVETLVEALNADVAAHGTRDLFAELVAKRLQAQALNVTWTPAVNRYLYDLAAFRDYLRRAPRGPSAPEAKFRLIAQRFYATLGPDPDVLGATDVPALERAAADEERFLAEHGAHTRADTVRFFLAVDHYRLARNVSDPARRAEHTRRARLALQQTVERSEQPFDVRAAQTLLERLAR
jgi:hypothetical protein